MAGCMKLGFRCCFFVFVFDLVFLTGYVPKSWGRLTLAICFVVVVASDEKFRLFFSHLALFLLIWVALIKLIMPCCCCCSHRHAGLKFAQHCIPGNSCSSSRRRSQLLAITTSSVFDTQSCFSCWRRRWWQRGVGVLCNSCSFNYT